MRGVFTLAAFLMLALPAPAPSQTIDPLVEEQIIGLGKDIPGRMTVPVTIGSAGPYPFTIDTGAERTVISRELAAALGLAPGANVRVTDITGSSSVKTVVIPSLKASTAGAEQIRAPIFGGNDLGAPGLLGLDSLSNHSVQIDFQANRIKLRPAKARRAPVSLDETEIVIHARSKFRQLIVSQAYYRGRQIFVILDTGTPVSLGNMAMMALVGRSKAKIEQITVTSVTGAKLNAQYTQVQSVKFGTVTFNNLPVAFADAAPFAAFGLRNKPALLLGMDALRLFRRVDIDFANREVRLAIPRSDVEPG